MIKKFRRICLPELIWKESDNSLQKRQALKLKMITCLTLMGLTMASPLLGAENINARSYEPARENEEMDTIPSELGLGLTWAGKGFRFQLWGDAGNRTAYNQVDKDSLLNPDDIFDAPRWINETELRLRLDGDITDQWGLFVRGRLGIEYLKSSDNQETNSIDELDQAFMTLNVEDEILMFFSAGKQRIRWGTGFYWNPVDTFNPQQDLQEIEPIEEGRNALRADFAFGSSSITGVVVPNSDSTSFSLENYTFEEGKKLVTGKFYTFLGNTDLTLYVSDREDEDIRWGASFSTVISDIQFFGEGIFWRGDSERSYVTRISDRMPAFDPIGNTQYTIPADFDISTRDDTYVKFVLGFQYTFSNDLTLIGEYYYQGDGYDKKDMDNYIEFLKYVGGPYQDDVNSTILAKQSNPQLEIPAFPAKESLLTIGNSLYEFADLRRNYFHLSATQRYAADKYDLSADLIISLDDLFEGRGGSLFFRPLIAYVAIPDWRFSLFSQLYIGANDTEFGILPYDYSLFGEIRYFF
jgi:hypothetical protein